MPVSSPPGSDFTGSAEEPFTHRPSQLGPQVLFIMPNPSTADELTEDPTINRCVGFVRSWGFVSLAVGNLFAYRATYPGELCASPDPVGSENDHWLTKLHEESSLTAVWRS